MKFERSLKLLERRFFINVAAVDHGCKLVGFGASATLPVVIVGRLLLLDFIANLVVDNVGYALSALGTRGINQVL